MKRLEDANALIAFKSTSDPVPEGSNLAADVFVLIFSTEWQREKFREHGMGFAAIDATHNTTYYENMMLFTLLVRDRWGHGELSSRLMCLSNDMSTYL